MRQNNQNMPVSDPRPATSDPVVPTDTETQVPEAKQNASADNYARLLPRFIRLRDAAFYLGMDRNRFNTEVRPHLTEIPIGKQGRAFDRLDLDTWADDYKSRNGRPGLRKETSLWDAKKHQASISAAGSGISTSKSEVIAFAKALAKATSKKQ